MDKQCTMREFTYKPVEAVRTDGHKNTNVTSITPA